MKKKYLSLMIFGWIIGFSIILIMSKIRNNKIDDAIKLNCNSGLNILVKESSNDRGWLIVNGQYIRSEFNYGSYLTNLFEKKQELRLSSINPPFRMFKLKHNDTIFIEKKLEKYFFILNCNK